MSLSNDQLLAFVALGRKLEAVGWEPAKPDAEPFESGAPDDQKKLVRKAISFIRQNAPALRTMICDGTNVKIGLQTTGNVVSATTDAVAMAGGMIVPAATIANALVQYGLGNFCRSAPA